MTETLDIPKTRSLRMILTEFVKEIFDSEDTIETEDVIARAKMAFDGDTEFYEAALRDTLEILIPGIMGSVVGQNKSHVASSSGTRFISKKMIDMTARERMAAIFEGTGCGGYQSILTLNKSQLLTVNDRDRERVDTISRRISWRDELASRLKDRQVVGDLSSRVLEDVWKKHMVHDEAD